MPLTSCGFAARVTSNQCHRDQAQNVCLGPLQDAVEFRSSVGWVMTQQVRSIGVKCSEPNQTARCCSDTFMSSSGT
jgi:hypothetical protein